MNLTKIRRDFPILKKGIIYLDNAASSLTPDQVLDQMMEYYHSYRANIHRGIHQLSQKASDEYANARTKISTFINSRSDEEIIITKNTSEGINIIARGLKWRKGDRIVTTNIEHHSNFIVWLRIKERYGVDVEIVQPDKEGIFNILDFENTIDDRTKLVAITHASNV
ncbi:aminotransferase class V-fold PLP-dependent enzyme, partial [Candidatus Bathyarchaeota archaeon]|nr:aminotransferase class V-fold PLP-dependent enzyme [Candidatus Bathyarchaeota archaeon]